jgi:hypothetical protein
MARPKYNCRYYVQFPGVARDTQVSTWKQAYRLARRRAMKAGMGCWIECWYRKRHTRSWNHRLLYGSPVLWDMGEDGQLYNYKYYWPHSEVPPRKVFAEQRRLVKMK